MTTEIKAGFGKKIIDFKSSDLPIREFSAKHSDLYARIMLITGATNYVLVSLDLTSLLPEAILQYQQLISQLTNIDQENIWITVTHTFAAPHLPSHQNTVEQKATYHLINDKIIASLTACCRQAQADLQSVRVGQATYKCPLNVNRNVATSEGYWLGRNLTGYSNHYLRILAFQKSNGQTNLVINYDIQQSILDHLTDDDGNRMISSDLMGAGLSNYEGSYQVAIFLPGAAGDQRPLFVGNPHQPFALSAALVAEQGALITECLRKALTTITHWQPLTHLTYKRQTFMVPTKVQPLTTFELKPTKHYDFSATGHHVNLHLTAVQFNHYVIVGTEPELNSQFGDQCREALGLDATAQLATLVNGAAKYLPTQSDFDQVTYQAMNTQLGQGSDTCLLVACHQFGHVLHKEESGC